jgi:hypothetical protein
VTRARTATLAFFVGATPMLGAIAVLPGMARPALAAPPRPVLGRPASGRPASGKAQPLTFNVAARITAMGPNGKAAGPAQTINAQVALNGPKARVQTLVNEQPVVVLYAPPYVYRLLPKTRSGVKWKLSSANKSMVSAFNPEQLLRDPTQLRTALLKGGAKRTANGALQGVPSEIYEIKGAPGRIQNLKMWLRRSDSLPLRLEAKGQGFQVVTTWTSYARPRVLKDVLFTPPARYNIRELRSAPSMGGL